MLTHSTLIDCSPKNGRGLPAVRPVSSSAMQRFLSTALSLFLFGALFCAFSGQVIAQERPVHHGGEATLVLPDLGTETFLGGIDGRTLLIIGLGIAAIGLVFGL